jgi:nitroreductase
VGALVRAATAAPSVHNSQPWRFRDREDRIELHLDVVLGELTHAADAEGAVLDRIGSSCR